MEKYDVIIIGAGQAGNPLSKAFAQAKKRTALIEEKYVGGTCINYGCTPTKTMIASAEMAYQARRSNLYGVSVQELRVDIEKVLERKEAIVTSFRDGGEKRIVDTGVNLIYGKATFIGNKILQVIPSDGTARELTADTIIINAGGKTYIPNIPGLIDIPFLDSTSIMELKEIPEHLVIIGGGYIALEFGQMFRRFGSQVTILQYSSQLLGREDEDVADAMRVILEEDGIKILLNASTTNVAKMGNNQINLQVNTPEGKIEVIGSHLMVAAGRVPNTNELGLAKQGIQLDPRGYIVVNDRLETNVAGIYAAGDIKGGPAFTHISYDDFRILKANLLEKGSLSTKGRMIPYVLFTDPQLGRIGLSENEAREMGLNYQVAKMPMNYVARAIETERSRGYIKAVVDSESKQILGAAVLGVEGGEIMSMLQIAMMGGLPFTALREAIFAHPTLAEGLNTLFFSLD
jgi:pyruvate/2-oxoglutarate dehydrogenase complex dihydrolipoamide dehydrogenase (E3) component